METWRNIMGYEGLYQISNCGRIKSLMNWNGHKHIKKETILSPWNNGKNYLKITLRKNNKSKKYYVHRLMAETFLNLKKNSKLQVDHIDNNRLNNNITNLQVLTQKENIKKQMLCMKNHIEDYKGNKINSIIKGCSNNER